KNLKRLDLYCCKLFLNFELCSVFCRETVVILTLVKLLRDTEKSRGAKHPCGCICASILAPQSHRKHKARTPPPPHAAIAAALPHTFPRLRGTRAPRHRSPTPPASPQCPRAPAPTSLRRCASRSQWEGDPARSGQGPVCPPPMPDMDPSCPALQ